MCKVLPHAQDGAFNEDILPEELQGKCLPTVSLPTLGIPYKFWGDMWKEKRQKNRVNKVKVMCLERERIAACHKYRHVSGHACRQSLPPSLLLSKTIEREWTGMETLPKQAAAPLPSKINNVFMR